MYKTNIAIIKSIQLRTEVLDQNGKVQYGWNKRFQLPSAAARHWVSHRIRVWEEKKFGGYHFMTSEDRLYAERVEKRLLRIATKKLKEAMAA